MPILYESILSASAINSKVVALYYQLVNDFSHEKQITQREIYEIALVEFFLKYGYENRVEQMLK